MAKFASFNFYTDDWFSGTRGMPHDLKAFYIDLLAVLWRRGGRLPNDPEKIKNLLVDFDIRQVRRLLRALIDDGKIIVHGDAIGNNRMDSELSKSRERSERATKRWSKNKATQAASSREVRPKSGGSSREVRSTSSLLYGENYEKSDAYEVQEAMHARALLTDSLTLEERKKENSQLATPRSVAASERAEELEGLNGATTEIVRGLARWLSPMMPDEATAKRVLARDVAIYGPQAVKDGYADLATAVDANDPISNPLKAFNGFVKRAAERQKAKADKPGKPARTAEQAQTARFDLWCKTFRDYREWKPDLGPPPGTPGCKVPIDILAKYGLPSTAGAH